MERRAGILLHPTSLPGPGPCGDLGEGAYRFLDWLHEAGCTLWQTLPLNPPGGLGFSPYVSPSALAAGTHLLSIDRLAADGLLDGVDTHAPKCAPGCLDPVLVQDWHAPLAQLAGARFAADAPDAVDAFAEANPWVLDWGLFRALSLEVGGGGWWAFDRALQEREPTALARARERLAPAIRTEIALQVLLRKQWQDLREAAHARDIHLVGDLPIFVAGDGCDTWVARDHFQGDHQGPQGRWRPNPVAGVPPDYFSETGQMWGNPHYAWPVHEQSGFRWWIERFRTTFELVDWVRVDHFRGFAAAWEIPADGDARKGRWVPAPGQVLFRAVRAALGELPLIAEDLGIINQEVHELRKELGLPGMKVLQFAFGDDDHHPFLPHTWTHPRWVVYTGTHDNDTVVGWYRSTDERSRHRYRVYTARSGEEVHWDLIRLAWSSIAAWAVTPLQDVLGLGNEARMNTPGLGDGNWLWRAPDLPHWAAARLGEMSRTYGRVPGA